MYQNNRSLFLLPLGSIIVLVIMFIIWYFWLGPGYEPGPVFPNKKPQGVFIESPTIVTAENETQVKWVVPTPCRINEVEFKQQGEAIENSNDWGGGTADCAEENRQFICQAALTDRGLVKGVTYRLQTNSDQCSNGEQYISEVITFSL